ALFAGEVGAEGDVAAVVDPRVLGEVEAAATRRRIARAYNAGDAATARRAEDTGSPRAIAAALSRGHDPGECEVPNVVEARVESRAQKLAAAGRVGDIRHHDRAQRAGACRVSIDANVQPQRGRSEGLESERKADIPLAVDCGMPKDPGAKGASAR